MSTQTTELIQSLKKSFPLINFTKALNHELDSLGQVDFLMKLETLWGQAIDPRHFEREATSIESEIQKLVSSKPRLGK